MSNSAQSIVFRLTRDGLWLNNLLLVQPLIKDQFCKLLSEQPRVVNVGGRDDSPHKVLLFDQAGLLAVHDLEREQIRNLTIVWIAEAEDYKLMHPFAAECWVNGRMLRHGMQIKDLPLSGDILFGRSYGLNYDAFFGQFYAQIKLTNRGPHGKRISKPILASLYFSFSTSDVPADFVAEMSSQQAHSPPPRPEPYD